MKPHRAAGTIALVVVAVAGLMWHVNPTSSAQRPVGPDAGSAGAAWTAAEDGPQPYPNVHIDWDVPIRMSDGVVLKANVYRPADASGVPTAKTTPTIVTLTPYTKLVSNLADSGTSIPGLSDAVLHAMRTTDLTGTPLSGITDLTKAFGNNLTRVFTVDRQLIRGGYTQMVVDVRGTGFSEGDWDVLRRREQRDSVEVINWAAHQPWSNGRIGMSGMSYSGINQLQAAEQNPPALKAIFPVVPGSDLVQDVLAPGGGVGVTFIPLWLLAVNTTKLIPDLQSLDPRWLANRTTDPFTFMDAVLNIYSARRVADLSPRVRTILTGSSPTRRAWLGNPNRIRVPTFVVGGWHDLFTNSETSIYRNMPLSPGRKQLLMGNTYHLTTGNEAGSPGLPPRLDVLQRAWFDHWLKGIDNGIDRYGPVTLHQQGGGWATSPSFAEPGIVYRRIYLSTAGSPPSAPTAYDGSLRTAPDPYRSTLTVAPGLTMMCSNDMAQATMGLGGILTGCATDSRVAERGALTFTGAPVAAPTALSGPINVHLDTAADARDAYWNVTVNDVAPDGRSTVIGSGQLQASMRRIDNSLSTRTTGGAYLQARPYITLSRRRPLVPGESTPLDISVPGTDAVLQPGHRLRISVYAGNFPKALSPLPFVLDSGLRPEHLLLNPRSPSYITIGIKGGPGR